MSASLIKGLEGLGHEIVIERPDELFAFGGAQIVMRTENGYVAAPTRARMVRRSPGRGRRLRDI